MSAKVSAILEANPVLDTVFVNASIQAVFLASRSLFRVFLARLFIPHLISVASSGVPVNLLTTSSSLAYVPLSFYPAYTPTKAGVHAFCVILRQQPGYAPEEVKRNLSVVEIVPPYVDTDLDKEHRATTMEMQGGPDKTFRPMPVNEYVDKASAALDELDDQGRLKKEVGVGFGRWASKLGGGASVKSWREWGSNARGAVTNP